MLNLRRLQDKKIKLASAKHSKIDIESRGKVLNLRRLRNRKIFERSSAPSQNMPRLSREASSDARTSSDPSETGKKNHF